VMDSDKSVTGNFAAVPPPTYTLSTSATDGSVSKTPDKTAYSEGETVTLLAAADSGYSFTGWSGDLSGSTNPATIVMDADKSVTANFAADTYRLDTSATQGSITKSPDRTSYSYGETVSVQAVADAGYRFTGWSGDLSGSANPANIVMDADKSVTALFAVEGPDTTAPIVADRSPDADSIQAPLNSLIVLHVVDSGEGVDANTVTIAVDGTTVYSGNTSSYSSVFGECRRTGTKADYAYSYQASEPFDLDQTIDVTVNAADLEGNAMAEHSYSFKTEMWSFGGNWRVSEGLDRLDKGSPATVRDSSGNIWAVWHAGSIGERDVYASRLAPGASAFDDPIKLTTDAADQGNPDIAIGTDDKLYVVWQDNRRGNWDIYVTTSADGVAWSGERRVTDSNDNQVSPAIAVDGASPNRVYTAWQDDRGPDQDIYVARSTDRYITKILWQVTSGNSDQTDPAIAVDSADVKYVVWTDRRNGSSDIYGAASDTGPWTNVALVTGAGNQFRPAIAVEAAGSVLHFAWVDDASGNMDIFCASSDSLPAGPVTGINIIDDTSGAEQTAPEIATTGRTGDDLRVFVCWQDERNMIAGGGDVDLYFAEVGSGTATNILVGDDGSSASQSEPAMGVDAYGYPYLLWTDDRNKSADVYYAGSTFIEPDALDSQLVTVSAGGIVGVAPEAISSVDDVSIVIPAQACSFDVTVSISNIMNPPGFATESLRRYEFGPSGLVFAEPVTVTIPYGVAKNGKVKAYWYDSMTDSLSQQGITDVEDITIGPGLHAVRFKTTHLTPYYLLSGDAAATGGNGGCALSPSGDSNLVDFLVPYMGLAVIMVVLRLRDRKARHSRIRGTGTRR
ncbi:MAG: hypothetical protein JSU70_05135, partial [Phycisphaerales bacterium]